jgi:hypothetical protein
MVAAVFSFLASTAICAAIVLLRPYHQRYSIDAMTSSSCLSSPAFKVQGIVEPLGG